jgi:hypothetical protein
MDYPCRHRQRFSPFTEAVNGYSTAHGLKGIRTRGGIDRLNGGIERMEKKKCQMKLRYSSGPF